VTDRQRDTIGALTFEAGHHTVYQHAHFEFGLENISRQLVWSVLHAYPFYNSEQSSQRYVKLKEPRAFVPPLAGEALLVYERAVLRAWEAYAELSALLKDDAFAILKELRYVTPRASAERLKAIEREAEKKAIETARYVIPIAAFTSMVHTLSGITLHRLRRMAAAGDAPYEARLVIGRMVDLVRQVDPLFFEKVGCDELGGTTCRKPNSRVPVTAMHSRAIRCPSRRARVPARGLVRQRGGDGCRRGAHHVRAEPRRDGRRRGDCARARPRRATGTAST
jgi:thymidylate synthase ThyX